jgi:hypothetical protein
MGKFPMGNSEKNARGFRGTLLSNQTNYIVYFDGQLNLWSMTLVSKSPIKATDSLIIPHPHGYPLMI